MSYFSFSKFFSGLFVLLVLLNFEGCGASSSSSEESQEIEIHTANYKDGTLMYETSYKKDPATGAYIIQEGLDKRYYKNGILMEETPYHNDLRDGTKKEYDPLDNGSLRQETTWIKGKKEGVQNYYRDGYLQTKTFYKDDKRDGLETHYYKDGTPKIETSYLNGNQVGTQKFYDKKGNIIAK